MTWVMGAQRSGGFAVYEEGAQCGGLERAGGCKHECFLLLSIAYQLLGAEINAIFPV